MFVKRDDRFFSIVKICDTTVLSSEHNYRQYPPHNMKYLEGMLLIKFFKFIVLEEGQY